MTYTFFKAVVSVAWELPQQTPEQAVVAAGAGTSQSDALPKPPEGHATSCALRVPAAHGHGSVRPGAVHTCQPGSIRAVDRTPVEPYVFLASLNSISGLLCKACNTTMIIGGMAAHLTSP